MLVQPNARQRREVILFLSTLSLCPVLDPRTPVRGTVRVEMCRGLGGEYGIRRVGKRAIRVAGVERNFIKVVMLTFFAVEKNILFVSEAAVSTATSTARFPANRRTSTATQTPI